MSSGDVSRAAIAAVRRGVAGFLAVVGLITLAIGGLYLLGGRAVPHLLQGHAHGGHHARRATVCLAAGVACVVVARLVRGRRAAT